MQKNKNDFVAVITINYNKTNFTLSCVESILKSSHINFSIVIVDNGSNDDEYKKLLSLKDNKIHVERIEKNRGYVGGINQGLKAAQKFNPDYFLIMNNDTILDKYAIDELVSTSRKYSNSVIVSGKVYNMDEPDTLQYIGQWCKNKGAFDYPPYIKLSKEKDVGQFDKEIEMDMLDDIFWLLPKNVFEKTGYYSTYFYLYGEQNDYALRAIQYGFKLIYTPKAKIWHYHHLTTGNDKKGYQRIYYWQTYASLLLAFLHLSGMQFLQVYVSKSIKIVTISIAYIVFFKFSKFKQNHMPKLFALWFFTKWLIHKKENDGFNPYK